MGRSDEHIQNRFDGGIGSGKSRVADMLAEWGASVVDTDEIARALTAAGGSAMPAIEQAFGAEALAEDGSLDRAWMRERLRRCRGAAAAGSRAASVDRR